MQYTLELLKGNSQLSCELKAAQKQSSFYEEAANASSHETAQLQQCIDKLHASLAQRCDLDGMYYIMTCNFVMFQFIIVALCKEATIYIYIYIYIYKDKFPVAADENGSLKKQVLEMKDSAFQLELEHKKQMSEAVENLQALKEEHRKELTEVKDKTKQQSWHETITSLIY